MCASTLHPVAALLRSAVGQLNTLAKAKGVKYFGTATDNPELSNTQYTAILDNTAKFGRTTPANTQKWIYTKPTESVFTFVEGDVITSLAKANGQLLRCPQFGMVQ
jgi:endo-1,4-beta-xylanase